MDTNAEERELKNKLLELEKELALSDEEFERRLIERLKKGIILLSNPLEIKSNKSKLEKGLKKEFVNKQKQIQKIKDEEIDRLKKENEELSNYISRIKILLAQ